MCSFNHFVSPAKFHIIPKIHKNPMVGRPIAASHSYITRPISIFIDELAKPKIRMPTVLRDSGELIQLLENTVLPNSECFLVTADVVSLYPNMNTKKALIALDLLLREARVPGTPLLIQLARLVFDNNYISSEFSPDIFHQVFGIAMGTPFAVTVANAFMLHHEKDIVEYYAQYLMLYKRFIDDIFAIWCGPKGTLFEFLNALKSKLIGPNLLIVLARVAFLFWICFSIEIPLRTCCNFQPFKSLLTNICTYPSSRFTLLAIRKPLSKGN